LPGTRLRFEAQTSPSLSSSSGLVHVNPKSTTTPTTKSAFASAPSAPRSTTDTYPILQVIYIAKLQPCCSLLIQLLNMVLDGGVISTSAITSTFTAALRISQAVYELKAVGEQTRDLLDTTKYVNSSLESVRELRRKKSSLLNREEKRWIDHQVEFTQRAVDNVAVLIERARVDMHAKSETGNEDDYKTKHIKIHHRARFVLRDGPKVQTNLMNVNMAMNGLNSAMVTLSSREGHDTHLRVAQSRPGGAPGRRSTSPGKAPPPYAEGGFMYRHKTVSPTQQDETQQKEASLGHGDSTTLHLFGTHNVPNQALSSRASMSSITPSIHFTSAREHYDENAINDDTIPPACLPTSSIRDSIGSEAYFSPAEMDASAHPPLHTHHSEPIVSQQTPPIPRKPLAYQTHRPNSSSITSLTEDFEQTLSSNPWASSTPSASNSPNRQPFDEQKPLPMLPLNLTPTASVLSLHNTLSDSGSNHTAMGPPPVSRGRSWLLDRANQAASGNTIPLSRSQSNNLPYPYHSLDYNKDMPGAWSG
jgi:hypothetical protein